MFDLNTLARLAKVIALIGFALPWVVVSCSNSEIARGNGFEMMIGQLHMSEQASSQMQPPQMTPDSSFAAPNAPSPENGADAALDSADASADSAAPAAEEGASDERQPEWLLIGAFAAILLGLLASLVLRKRIAGGALFAGALAGIILSYAAIEHLRSVTTDALVEQQMDQQGQSPGPDPGADADMAAQMQAAADEMQRSMRESIVAQLQVKREVGFWMTIIALIVATVFGAASAAGLRILMPPEAMPKS